MGAALQGVVVGPSAEAEYELWLVDTLDLAAPGSPVARSGIDPVSGRFDLPLPDASPAPPLWLFLRQTVRGTDGSPMTFWLPWNLEPLDRADLAGGLEIRSLPVDLAARQAGGERVAGWWTTPLVLIALLLLGVPLLWVAAWAWSRRLGPGGGPPRTRPILPPVARWEGVAIGVLLVLAVALRLPRMIAEPLELLEHAYGPGLPGIREVAPPPIWVSLPAALRDPSAARDLLQGLLEPPSLIVTHPPLYHWLLAALVGGPEWLLRLPALVSCLLCLVLLWRLFRRVGPIAGVAAAFAWTICAPGIHFGGDASPYALVGAVCTGSILAALRALEDGRSRAWAVWLGALAVGFLCHYTTAIFGVFQAAVLAVAFAAHLRDKRWAASLVALLRVVPPIFLLPVLWTFPHFATFEVVGLDTRLMSESYSKTPGFAVFGREMLAVLCGVSPRVWWAAAPVLVLACAGIRVIARRDRLMAALGGAALAAGALAVVFFYRQHVQILDGRIYWGFRWVSWLVPVALGIASAPLAARRGPRRRLAAALALLWLPPALLFSFSEADRSIRPDYRGAARIIARGMRDGDGVATTPMWGQRGPLLWYVSQEGGFDVRLPGADLPVRLWLNPIHEQLPLETSAWNGHVDRLWLARVDERIFGHPKFMLAHADQALAWARKAMVEAGSWHLYHLDLYLFERGQGGAWDGREPLMVTHPEFDIRSLRWQEPNLWHCGQQPAFEKVRPEDQEARFGWRLLLRVPLAPGLEAVRAEVSEGAITELDEPGYWSAVVDGGQCQDAPPVVRLSVGP